MVCALAERSVSTEKVYAYSAYGEAAVLGPDAGNALRYTGREDDGNGLFYYRARYYDPVLKRFVSEDPIGLEAGPNFYPYVLGDPISLTDPEGEFPPQVSLAALGFLGNVAYQLWQNGGNFGCVSLSQAGAWALAGSGLGAIRTAGGRRTVSNVLTAAAIFGAGGKDPAKAIKMLNQLLSSRQTAQQVMNSAQKSQKPGAGRGGP
jgi:RHS repeat-associated protein